MKKSADVNKVNRNKVNKNKTYTGKIIAHKEDKSKVISRALSIVVMLILLVSVFSSCNNSNSDIDNKTKIRVAGLIGSTGLGMSKLMDDNQANNDYEFTLSSAPDEIVGKVSSGDVDVAAIPTNLAATLYNKTNGKVQMAALNTLGVLYVLEKGDTINSIQDLKGKDINASIAGATPEFIFDFILKQNGIDPEKDLNITWSTEHSEVVSLCLTNTINVVMLPEPNVSNVLIKNSEYRMALDLTEEYKKACAISENQDSFLAMGCLIVNKEFAQKNKEVFNEFLDKYKASVDYVNSNVDAAAKLAVKYEIIPSEEIAKRAIPNCNITYIEGEEMKDGIGQFFDILFGADPKSVGGKLPGEDFYYSR